MKNLKKIILGFIIALVGAILVLVGFFMPWYSAYDRQWGLSWDASALDSVMGQTEGWTILALVATVVTIVGFLLILPFHKTKVIWCVTCIGGVLAVTGTLWAFLDIDTKSFYDVSFNYGTGLYLTLVGGTLCFIGSFVGLLVSLHKKSLLD